MNSRLEENRRLFDVLSALAKGYSTGDFDDLFPFLARDCVMESQWVLIPNTGYDEIVYYYTGKGETFKKTKSFSQCRIVELIGDSNPVRCEKVHLNDGPAKPASVCLIYPPGKLCLLAEQELDGQTNCMIIDVKLNDVGLVKRIDLCMPEFFRYRDFDSSILLFPATDE